MSGFPRPIILLRLRLLSLLLCFLQLCFPTLFLQLTLFLQVTLLPTLLRRSFPSLFYPDHVLIKIMPEPVAEGRHNALSNPVTTLIAIGVPVVLGLVFLGVYWVIRRFFYDQQPDHRGVVTLPELPQSTYVQARQGQLAGGSDCRICLDQFQDADLVSVLPQCRHLFHARCIRRWIVPRSSQAVKSATTTCPICHQTYRLATADSV